MTVADLLTAIADLLVILVLIGAVYLLGKKL